MNKRMLAMLVLGTGLSSVAAWAQSKAAPPKPAAPAQVSTAESVASKARSLDGRGRPDLAAQAWRQVLLVDPNHQEALAALARYAKQSGKDQEANTYLARLETVNPKHPAITQIRSMRVLTQQQARIREAERLAGLQQFDRALQVYREVYGDDPPDGGQAIAYYETQAAVPGGWETATGALKALSDKYPQSEDYRLSLGKLLTYRPNTRMNGLRLLESIKNSGDLANKARVAWRQALIWEDANPQFAPSLRAYLARYPDPDLQKSSANLNRPTRPVQRTGLARTPVENSGYTALAAGSLAEAEAQFEKALEENPASSGALAGMGFVRMKQENFAAAVEYFENAAKAAPQEALVMESLQSSRYFMMMRSASAAFYANALDKAAEDYRKAIEIRSTAEASQGLAGSLAKAGNWSDAMPVYEKLTQMQPQNETFWLGLLTARYRVAGADSFLAAVKQVPDGVRLKMSQGNVEYLAMLATASSESGHIPEAKGYLQQAVDIANARALPLSPDLEMQFAGLFLRLGYAVESATVFERVAAATPENADAWEGLAAALVQVHQEARAYRSLERMPRSAYQKAMDRPSFLRSLAAIQMSLGGLDLAREFLKRSIEIDTAGHTAENVAAQLQLAHIMLRQSDAAQAEMILRKMASTYPENPDVWKALVAALHQEGRDDLAIEEARRVPARPGIDLQDDADYISLLASVEDVQKHTEQALRLSRRAAELLTRGNRPLPADLQIQTAWLILKTEGDERELLSLLQTLGALSDLSTDQTKTVNEIWSTWSLKRANAALASGEYPRAIAILQGAAKILPKDAAIRSTLAGVYLKTGEQQKAMIVYREWGMANANAQDFAGAIGAAITAGDKAQASDWTNKALGTWPNDPALLKLAGQQAAAAGDLRRAETFWRAALVAMPDNATQAREAQAAAIQTALPREADPKKAMGELLLGNDAVRSATPSPAQPPVTPRPATPSTATPNADERLVLPNAPSQMRPAVPLAAPKDQTQPTGRPQAAATMSPEFVLVAQNQPLPSLRPDPPPAPASTPQQSAAQPAAAPALAPQAVAQATAPVANNMVGSQTPTGGTLRDELQDRINAVQARNTPFAGFGGMVRARSGEAGFERLIVQEANLEASTVLANSIRLGVIARPTYLDAGTPDGQSEKRFGILPAGATFGSQGIGGIGGEAQLSTQTFGLRAGATPQNFLVPNFIGGIRFRPGNGPITLIAERESIRDSLLSFAGARDPISNRVWGGVVSTGVSAIGKFGGEKSGFYGSFGYQNITGRQVQRNQRLDGNVGAYWQIFKNTDGALTAGFNLFGMHYEKNLRFYTLGHGGYFSPQRFILMSFPVEWRGLYQKKLQYMVNGSLGSQHFEEERSAYFPTLPALQGKDGPYYPSRASTGANYNMDARIAYQVTPEWHMGLYVNFNNTRNYSSQSVGLYLRYSTRPRSIRQEFGLPSVPDWKGVEPFGLP